MVFLHIFVYYVCYFIVNTQYIGKISASGCSIFQQKAIDSWVSCWHIKHSRSPASESEISPNHWLWLGLQVKCELASPARRCWRACSKSRALGLWPLPHRCLPYDWPCLSRLGNDLQRPPALQWRLRCRRKCWKWWAHSLEAFRRSSHCRHPEPYVDAVVW